MVNDEDDTRRRLLDNARAHYLEVGGSAHFSLREVARRSGVSPAAVYRHFEGKDFIYRTLITEGFRIFHVYLMQSLAEPTPLERLRAAGRQYLAFAGEHWQHYSVIFMTRHTTKPAVGHDADNAATFQFLVDRVRECVEAKVLREDEPSALAAAIWAHVHGLVSLRLTGHLRGVGSDEAFARFYSASVDDFLHALAPHKRERT